MTYYGVRHLADAFRTVRKNTIAIAQDIPEDKYAFKAAPNTRTVSQLVAAGPTGPRKGMKIFEIGHNGGAGSGEIEISHGAIEAEQLFDPERA